MDILIKTKKENLFLINIKVDYAQRTPNISPE